MKPILRIYFGDLSRIGRNWAAAVIVIGLACLPSLYAWFNIEASWDPYGRTGGLKVAVANNDRGSAIRGTPVRIGNDIVEALRSNPAIGWTFVDEPEAIRGVEHGDYYAAIVIPDNFSDRIATVLSDNPQKAELLYYVNEKINAISPKITGKGASGIIEEVSRNFIKTANGTIFRILNEIGVELEQQLPTIETVRDAVFRLEAMLPDIERAVAIAEEDVRRAEEIVAGVQSRLPVVARLAKDGAELADRLAAVLDRGSDAFAAAGPDVKHSLLLLATTADAAAQIAEALRDNKTDPALAAAGLEQLSRRLASASRAAGTLLSLFDRLNAFAGGDRLAPVAAKLGQAQASFDRQRQLADSIRAAIAQGAKPADELVAELASRSREAADALGGLYARYDSDVQPAVLQGLDKARLAAQSALGVLQDANRSMPDVERIVGDAAAGLAIGGKALQDIRERLPAAAAKIRALADRIRAMEKQGSLSELIGLLRKDASKESEFFAEPVVLRENRLFPIPNYGSAMSPFFSTLSVWVGALLLVSLLSVEVHDPDASWHSYQVYFGRYLTFWTVSMVQTALVTIGDMALLHTYVAEPVWFVLFGLVIGTVFMMIVYTLVSVFGNVGKAMAIVLLVLQLAGSGGTFPIQVTPAFFQAIYPYLPFTYAIGLMREAVGGILWDIVVRDLCMLGVFAALALIVGITLKEWINKSGERLVRKAKESGLLH
ncbi:YhgE/Pip domain-containing protein [Paenibacillus flagellatus]|uniref:YhgE/Pip domain-containing protein n=1 Tax=Paenibacillus flagellatus TaxID=2211139 RepID=A0A2V5KHS9_9BACL|nr:YhgE/Pip domain-containing protein [Paenibacillus flagellatus]PYI53910.1 YhgE/Pip domain-containing protein [Paenibacillus flagellatus]